METVEVKMRQLPANLKKEVEDFVDFLLEKKVKTQSKKPNLNWIGGLKEYKDIYSALELQKNFDKDFDKTDIGRKEPQEVTILTS